MYFKKNLKEICILGHISIFLFYMPFFQILGSDFLTLLVSICNWEFKLMYTLYYTGAEYNYVFTETYSRVIVTSISRNALRNQKKETGEIKQLGEQCLPLRYVFMSWHDHNAYHLWNTLLQLVSYNTFRKR